MVSTLFSIGMLSFWLCPAESLGPPCQARDAETLEQEPDPESRSQTRKAATKIQKAGAKKKSQEPPTRRVNTKMSSSDRTVDSPRGGGETRSGPFPDFDFAELRAMHNNGTVPCMNRHIKQRESVHRTPVSL